MKNFEIIKFPLLGFLLGKGDHWQQSYAVCLDQKMQGPVVGRADPKQESYGRPYEWGFIPVPPQSYKVFVLRIDKKLPEKSSLHHLGYQLGGNPPENWEIRGRTLLKQFKAGK